MDTTKKQILDHLDELMQEVADHPDFTQAQVRVLGEAYFIIEELAQKPALV